MKEINQWEIVNYNIYNLPKEKYSTCPKCSKNRKPENQNKKVLMINWDKGLATCQHCHEVIQLHKYKHPSTVQKSKLVTNYKKPKKISHKIDPEMLNYLVTERKISPETLKKMRVSSDMVYQPAIKKKALSIIFDYYRNNELVNYKARDLDHNYCGYPGAELIPYNLDCIRTYEDVIITEGEIDALSFIEAGYLNTTSVPAGGNENTNFLNNNIDYFDNKKKIFLALDNDEIGQKAQKALAIRLGIERCYIVNFHPHKDANEVLVNEGKDSLKNRLEKAPLYPLENVERFLDNEKTLDDFLINGFKKGFTVDVPIIDDIFSTNFQSVITVTGIPNHGKSTFLDFMAIRYIIKYDWKIAICAIENKPLEIHKGKLLRMICGYETNTRKLIDTEEIKTIKTFLDEHIFWILFDKQYELRNVLEKTRELIKRNNVKCVILDPYNKIILKESNRSEVNIYTSDYYCLLDEFVRTHNIICFLLAHPNKMSKIQVKSDQNQMNSPAKYSIPDFYDVKGGAEAHDMADHGLSVYKLENGETLINVMKLKNHHLGKTNKIIRLKFDGNNYRYYNAEDDKPDLSNWLPLKKSDKSSNSNGTIKEEGTNGFNIFPSNTLEEKEEIPF